MMVSLHMNERVIINKRGQQWKIPEDAKGIPIQEAWPDHKIPDSMKNALIYKINGQEIIAMQDFAEVE